MEAGRVGTLGPNAPKPVELECRFVEDLVQSQDRPMEGKPAVEKVERSRHVT
jgi:hypothetical protein